MDSSWKPPCLQDHRVETGQPQSTNQPRTLTKQLQLAWTPGLPCSNHPPPIPASCCSMAQRSLSAGKLWTQQHRWPGSMGRRDWTQSSMDGRADVNSPTVWTDGSRPRVPPPTSAGPCGRASSVIHRVAAGWQGRSPNATVLVSRDRGEAPRGMSRSGQGAERPRGGVSSPGGCG